MNRQSQNYEVNNFSKDTYSPRSTAPPNITSALRKKMNIIPCETENLPIWKQSSTSLTRDHSPAHKMPKSNRFMSIEEQEMKNSLFLKLQLRQDISSPRGIRFPKSKRPDHFYKFSEKEYPSPASYNHHSFLDHKGIQPQYSDTMNKTANPQSVQHKAFRSTMKGVTIPSFKQYHKSFIKHSEHIAYQPQSTLGNPGPGQYHHNFKNKHSKPNYSFRKPLKRFNEIQSMNPGPGAYEHITSRDKYTSLNIQGTIPKSFRTYLTKFNENPSPQKYKLKRFLDQTI